VKVQPSERIQTRASVAFRGGSHYLAVYRIDSDKVKTGRKINELGCLRASQVTVKLLKVGLNSVTSPPCGVIGRSGEGARVKFILDATAMGGKPDNP
jgi:hypothetical protein